MLYDELFKLDYMTSKASAYKFLDVEDSLVNVIKSSYSSSIYNRFHAHAKSNRGLMKFYDGEMETCISIYEEALSHALSSRNKKMIGNIYNDLAYMYGEVENIPKSEKTYLKSLAVRKEIQDSTGVAQVFNNLGYMLGDHGRYEEAIDYLHKSLKIREKIDDKRGVAISLNNIANLYNTQKEYERALEYQMRGLAIRREVGDAKLIATGLNSVGVIYYSLKQNDEALKYYQESYSLRKQINDIRGISSSLNNIANVYYRKGEYNKAREYYMENLKVARQSGNKSSYCQALINLAYSYNESEDFKLAEIYGDSAITLASEIGWPSKIERASGILYTICQNQNNFKKALEMYKLHIQMRDSLNNSATQKATAKQQARYEYEKQKAVDDAEHEKQLAIEQEAKEKQQILTYATAGGLGLVGIFLIFVFNRLKVTRKQKGIIEDAHAELGEKNKEILDSINYAKRIQSAILPPNKVVKEYLQESFILYKPKDIVAGDFYWLEHVKDKVLFAAADCTGHGVPGAMVSVVCNNGLNRSVREHKLTNPGEILTKTREIVVAEFEKSEEEVKDGMDIALCSLQGNILEYAGAHNPLWVIRKGSGEIEEIKSDKQPIGKTDNPEPYTTHKLELQKGDTIYIFSDGYADQFGGEKGKKMKTASFKKLLLSIQNESIEKQKELLDEAFKNWKGELEQLDDVCVIGVRV